MYEINWTARAAKQLLKLQRVDQKKIRDAVTTLTDLPNAKNVKALVNHQFGYRLRVGNHRVLFDADNEVRIVDVQEVRKRDDNTY